MIGAASILKNTQKIVSSTFDNWQALRIGSFFRFKNDQTNYIISKVEPLFYLIEFEKVADNKLKINGNTEININIHDSITISFKEWELQTILSIKNAGKGYKNGQVLDLNIGKPSHNIQDNLIELAKIKVENTDDSGAITNLSIVNKGRYYEVPTDNIISFGSAALELQFKNCDNRKMIERGVSNIEFNGRETFITLDYNLPKEIQFGKVGADKWIAYINTPYIEETKINQPYEVLKDFTPYLQIPLMVKNSLSSEKIFNEAILKIENKIKELEGKIKN